MKHLSCTGKAKCVNTSALFIGEEHELIEEYIQLTFPSFFLSCI